MLAFYNSFLKIVLNCEKENILILNTYSFHKKMLSNLKCSLIYSLAKFVLEDGFKDKKFSKTCRNIFMTELTVKEVTVQYLESPHFLNEALCQI